MRNLIPVVAVLSSLVTAPLGAQTCLGFPAFSGGKLALGGSVSSGNNASELAATLTIGSGGGAFGGASLGRTEFDNSTNSAMSLGVNLGFEIQSQPTTGFTLCPAGSFTRVFGPDFSVAGVETESNGTMITGGATFGSSFKMTDGFSWIPFGGASFVHLRTSQETAGVETSNTENYLGVSGGLGMSFNGTLTLTPSVVVPFGLEGADPVFTLAVRFNLGKR
ncbi:MAG TPA: hypothetical protein VJR92_01805 [Gemmatimonadaceae bacterium]|nr:hypothetical protein [Gemmatimonadaceae bacterium]